MQIFKLGKYTVHRVRLVFNNLPILCRGKVLRFYLLRFFCKRSLCLMLLGLIRRLICTQANDYRGVLVSVWCGDMSFVVVLARRFLSILNLVDVDIVGVYMSTQILCLHVHLSVCLCIFYLCLSFCLSE